MAENKNAKTPADGPVAWMHTTAAGLVYFRKKPHDKVFSPQAVYTAEQVAAAIAAEREKVAQWMMRQGYATGHGDTVEDLLKELEWQVRESEREACVKLFKDKEGLWDAEGIVYAIRART